MLDAQAKAVSAAKEVFFAEWGVRGKPGAVTKLVEAAWASATQATLDATQPRGFPLNSNTRHVSDTNVVDIT